MIKLPPKATKGWTHHIKMENRLREAIRRSRVIPTNGFQETQDGILPPPLPNEYSPQFAPFIHQVNSEVRLTIRPGYVFAPTSISTSGDEMYGPQLAHFPHECKIASTLLSADPAPYLTLTNNTDNFIWLSLAWEARTTQLGSDAMADSDYGYELMHELAAGATAVTNTGSDGGVWLQLEWRHYTLDPDSAPVFSITVGDTIPKESEGTSYVLAGFVTLDDTAVTDRAWFIAGPMWPTRNPVLMQRWSGATQDRTEPPAITTATGATIPLWSG